jgi:putative endonuclease
MSVPFQAFMAEAKSVASHKQTIGKKGETIAVRYLEKQGYKIIEQNYRSNVGEIDIIAREKKTLVFVEVKTRRSTSYGSPKWAVTPNKQRAISKAALYYLKMTGQTHADARFDVVSILAQGEDTRIELVRNAFDLAYP